MTYEQALTYLASLGKFGMNFGLARIENVPPGDYELTAWHPDLGQFKPPLTSKVTVGASGTTQTTVKFEFKPRPIRRAPKTADGKVAMAHHH